MKKARGLKSNAAELLLEKWLRSEGWEVDRAARAGFVRLPNGKAFCKSHDRFGCLDFIAFRGDETWGIQVTSPDSASAKSDRRRKIETKAWPSTWRVSLVVHERTPDPANRVRSLHFWRCQDYVRLASGNDPWLAKADYEWRPAVAIPFDKAVAEKFGKRAQEAGEDVSLLAGQPDRREP